MGPLSMQTTLLQPNVLETESVQDFIEYILENHALPSTLIVCSSKTAFVEALQYTPSPQLEEFTGSPISADHEQATDAPTDAGRNLPSFHWTAPTLRLLSKSRKIKVVFCPDVMHFRAYLSSYCITLPEEHNQSGESSTWLSQPRLLAILSPIQLHRQTSYFSGQGLNRTFSGAVEAAFRTGSKLVIAEPAFALSTEPAMPGFEPELDSDDRCPPSNPWDEEVSILNVTTKSFGVGERGWIGRTVSIRTILGRWCTFQTISKRNVF